MCHRYVVCFTGLSATTSEASKNNDDNGDCLHSVCRNAGLSVIEIVEIRVGTCATCRATCHGENHRERSLKKQQTRNINFVTELTDTQQT